MKLQWHQIMTMLRSMTPCLTGASADAAQQATENKWNFSGCRVFILRLAMRDANPVPRFAGTSFTAVSTLISYASINWRTLCRARDRR
jgi:hypothetical protein